VDLNRCGVPLIEIVSEPDIRSPHEAYLYLRTMHQLVTYLGICDGNMEEGSLRCDANVSVRRKGDMSFGTKTELKNMNSFRHVERALEFEISRQIQLIEDGRQVVQETLLWDADQNVAFPMRSKEEEHDYRYFPDPDLVPVLVDANWIERIQKGMPEIPAARRDRYVNEFSLPEYDADVLTAEKGTADYFEATLQELCTINNKSPRDNAKGVSNWVMTDVLHVVGEKKIEIKDFIISPRNLASMIGLIHDGTISGKIAKIVFEEMLKSNRDPKSLVEDKGLVQISDVSAIENAVDQIISGSTPQVDKYLAGNEKLFGFFVGETMKVMKGKANPKVVNEILKRKLDKLRIR
jgi:aspartyl-tRNA(Asn)/glutamyl-tRNA(Gln) amidotransferase subunit B